MRNKRLEIRDRGGNVISLRKFKAANKEKLLTYAVAKKQLISNGIFTRAKLKKLVEKNELRAIVFAGEVYFKRDEIASYLKDWMIKNGE